MIRPDGYHPITTPNGYSEHGRGYSGSFSWWQRHNAENTQAPYVVCGHVDGFADRTWSATTDDFGNLVPCNPQ